MPKSAKLKILIGLPSYWQAYGGAFTLLKSKFFWLALLITWMGQSTWSQPKWWDQVTTVLPTILGFTIAAFSIFLSLGNRIYKGAVHKRRSDGVSLYLKICAIFAHQVLVQASAVLLAIVLPTLYQRPVPRSGLLIKINDYILPISWAVGYFLFIYGVLLVIAGGMNVFSVATLLQAGEEVEYEKRDKLETGVKRRWLVRSVFPRR